MCYGDGLVKRRVRKVEYPVQLQALFLLAQDFTISIWMTNINICAYISKVTQIQIGDGLCGYHQFFFLIRLQSLARSDGCTVSECQAPPRGLVRAVRRQKSQEASSTAGAALGSAATVAGSAF